MTLLWPEALWLSPLAGAFILMYFLLLRRRRTRALQYPSVDLAREAMGRWQRARIHVPALLLLLALLGLMTAVARPSFVTTPPGEDRTVILAIDVSYSMAAADVRPTRLAAAQTAAKSLVRELPLDVRVGILDFASSADLVQAPTASRDNVIHAIRTLEFRYGSSPGMALIAALLTLFPAADIGRGYDVFGSGRTPHGFDRFGDARTPLERAVPVAPGTYAPAVIVLFTDGGKTMGPNPLKAATEAAKRGVRIYTVGVGTLHGASIEVGGSSVHVRFDDEGLIQLADVTSGKYRHVSAAREGKEIGRKLGAEVMPRRAGTELTAVFTAVAALFALASGALSLRRAPCLT